MSGWLHTVQLDLAFSFLGFVQLGLLLAEGVAVFLDKEGLVNCYYLV